MRGSEQCGIESKIFSGNNPTFTGIYQYILLILINQIINVTIYFRSLKYTSNKEETVEIPTNLYKKGNSCADDFEAKKTVKFNFSGK